MKLLADENFPPSLITYLQKKRHNIKRIQRTSKGIADTSVREQAIKENRIIITFDKDFLTEEPSRESVSVMVLYFPDLMPEGILPYMDAIIKDISNLRKKKKPFVAIYSRKGLEIIKPKL